MGIGSVHPIKGLNWMAMKSPAGVSGGMERSKVKSAPGRSFQVSMLILDQHGVVGDDELPQADAAVGLAFGVPVSVAEGVLVANIGPDR